MPPRSRLCAVFPTRSQPVKRRTFLKGSAAAVGGAVALGFDLRQARAEMRELKIARTTETRSTCPYCAVSCGVIIHTLGDKAKNVKASVVHVEGDPDHPISRGTLCPKGASLRNDITHANRLTSPKVRRPGSDHWEDISWDEAIAGIARHVKDTRDRTLVEKNAKGEVVNRTPNAKLVAVDPRFTRTAAVADLYAPIRPGTDIAFLLGMIRYAIEKKRYHEDYVKLHTNAPYVIGDKFRFSDGLFSGFDQGKG